MTAYAIRFTQSEDEGADIVQEIFVSLWRRRESLEIKGALPAYLMKSTRNLCLRYMEQHITKHGFLERFSLHMQSVLTESHDTLSIKELQEQVDKIIDTLPRKMREVYLLSRGEQLSHWEIAQKLGIAETTVKKQISNALKILSNNLSKEYPISVVALMSCFLG